MKYLPEISFTTSRESCIFSAQFGVHDTNLFRHLQSRKINPSNQTYIEQRKELFNKRIGDVCPTSFISYATEDRERARTLAASLEGRGWSVWWDRKIVPGQSFDQVIERELEAAKCVVVLWSESSITSEWVKNEAASAAERGALVPALIDNVKIPLEFRRKQTADLIGFKGDSSHGGFQALCDGITNELSGGTTPPEVSPPSSLPRWNRSWVLGSIIVACRCSRFGTLPHEQRKNLDKVPPKSEIIPSPKPISSNGKNADQIPPKPVPSPAPIPWVENSKQHMTAISTRHCVPFK